MTEFACWEFLVHSAVPFTMTCVLLTWVAALPPLRRGVSGLEGETTVREA